MTFKTILTKEGVILVSQISTDFPFVLIKNERMGFLPMQADYADYRVRSDARSNDLDFSRMVLYTGYDILTNGRFRWVLAIPFRGSEIEAKNYLPDMQLDPHKTFSQEDLPSNFEQYNQLAVVCGFPE